jgi:hypothetical protein
MNVDPTPSIERDEEKRAYYLALSGSTPWQVSDTSIIHFAGYDDIVTAVADDGYSCVIQAGTKEGVAQVNLAVEGQIVSVKVTVISDQVQVTRKKVEAPAVGNGTSTSQLYLMSNIGSDVYQNKANKPRELMNARIAAVINNSFSAGYPMLASGEQGIKCSTMDLSNLSFRLVDGNFRPLKLLNPMYINLQVMPMDANPVGDISSFQGKLPKDRPTPREARKQQEEQVALQMQQLQISEVQKQKTDALMKELTPAQQLQFLALSPEQREYFRTFNEKQVVQTEDQALEEQQLALQLAQRAEAQMGWVERWKYSLAAPEKQKEIIAQKILPQMAQIK